MSAPLWDVFSGPAGSDSDSESQRFPHGELTKNKEVGRRPRAFLRQGYCCVTLLVELEVGTAGVVVTWSDRRFRMITSSMATDALPDVESIFQTRTIAEVREVEAKTRHEIQEKREQLRHVVGDSYRYVRRDKRCESSACTFNAVKRLPKCHCMNAGT
jgi:hypothetical protein